MLSRRAPAFVLPVVRHGRRDGHPQGAAIPGACYVSQGLRGRGEFAGDVDPVVAEHSPPHWGESHHHRISQQPTNPATYDFTDIINRLDNGDYGPAN